MRIPGRKILRRNLWRMRGSIFGGGVILGYHRVMDHPLDVLDLCVPPDRFEAQMEVLRRDFRPVSLPTLVADPMPASRRDPLPVAVTFDDGYADVLQEALPALERYEVPATVFVVLDGLGGRFWWDRLQGILQTGGQLPVRLDLEVGAVAVAWSKDAGTQALHRDLYATLAAAESDLREQVLAALEDWAGQDGARLPPTPALLTETQLGDLDAHALIEIGSHGATHVELVGLDPEALHREIDGSRAHLERILHRGVESFSYPHGVVDDLVRDQVAAAGYRRACASWNGLVSKGADPFRLPRLWPSRQSGREFRRWLHGWTGR